VPIGPSAASGPGRIRTRDASRVAVRGAGRRLVGLLVASVVVAWVLAGCGSAGSTPAELRLQREDLVAVSRALATAERPVAVEVAAAKRAWPPIANGLPSGAEALASTRVSVAAAATSAARVPTPPALGEAQADSLTGPGAALAGLFRNYIGLSTRGWTLTGAAIDQIEHDSPAVARFARENVGLYIESIYDGHFDLAQIGKHLTDGYRRLGGPSAFGRALTQDEVEALADAYSEANVRLHPHVGVRLGS
jgi:hypothetical protein